MRYSHFNNNYKSNHYFQNRLWHLPLRSCSKIPSKQIEYYNKLLLKSLLWRLPNFTNKESYDGRQYRATSRTLLVVERQTILIPAQQLRYSTCKVFNVGCIEKET